MILKVARIGHPVVRAAARPVPPEVLASADFQQLVDDMVDTMHEYEGVGLAGPQVHVGLRVAVLEVPASDERARVAVPLTVLVNPVVTPLGEGPDEPGHARYLFFLAREGRLRQNFDLGNTAAAVPQRSSHAVRAGIAAADNDDIFACG